MWAKYHGSLRPADVPQTQSEGSGGDGKPTMDGQTAGEHPPLSGVLGNYPVNVIILRNETLSTDNEMFVQKRLSRCRLLIGWRGVRLGCRLIPRLARWYVNRPSTLLDELEMSQSRVGRLSPDLATSLRSIRCDSKWVVRDFPPPLPFSLSLSHAHTYSVRRKRKHRDSMQILFSFLRSLICAKMCYNFYYNLVKMKQKISVYYFILSYYF